MLTDDRHGYEHRDIVILSLKSEAGSILNGINKISGIPITREKTNSSILFTTASKYKGLESRAVIIVDIGAACFNDEEKKRNFYVACSRATQYLALFVNGDDSKIKNIADAIGGNAHFAAKGHIAMKTQSNILDLDQGWQLFMGIFFLRARIEFLLSCCITEEESTQDNMQVNGGVFWEIINRLSQ